MTKSRAYDMAESYVATELTWDLCESAAWQEVAESTFLAGMKAMLEEATGYCNSTGEGISSDWGDMPAWGLLEHLRKLMEQDGKV